MPEAQRTQGIDSVSWVISKVEMKTSCRDYLRYRVNTLGEQELKRTIAKWKEWKGIHFKGLQLLQTMSELHRSNLCSCRFAVGLAGSFLWFSLLVFSDLFHFLGLDLIFHFSESNLCSCRFAVSLAQSFLWFALLVFLWFIPLSIFRFSLQLQWIQRLHLLVHSQLGWIIKSFSHFSRQLPVSFDILHFSEFNLCSYRFTVGLFESC